MIVVDNVTKVIGKTEVLKNISYHFESGQIYGLAGRNGAGKTMLLRVLSGLVIPTKGKITIDNRVLHEQFSFPESMGIVIENMQMLPQLTAFENLKGLSKIKKVADDIAINETLDRVGLSTAKNLKVAKFSLGMKQRLNIAQAIFENPRVILLDEPMNAIDEFGVQEIRQLLLEEKEKDKIIIVASHLNEDLNDFCDVKIMVREGEII